MADDRYPHQPGFQAHSETSRTAAENLLNADSQQADIMRLFKDAGENGCTADEITVMMREIYPMVENGHIAARMARIKANGWVFMKKEKRNTIRNRPAEVWVHKDFASQDDVAFTLEAVSSKRNLKREDLEHVANFLKGCVDGDAFKLPNLYNKRAHELEMKIRAIAEDMKK